MKLAKTLFSKRAASWFWVSMHASSINFITMTSVMTTLLVPALVKSKILDCMESLTGIVMYFRVCGPLIQLLHLSFGASHVKVASLQATCQEPIWLSTCGRRCCGLLSLHRTGVYDFPVFVTVYKSDQLRLAYSCDGSTRRKFLELTCLRQHRRLFFLSKLNSVLLLVLCSTVTPVLRVIW